MKYTYCPISQEVKQPDNKIWSVNRYNMKKNYLKIQTQIVMEILVQDPFQKDKIEHISRTMS